MIEFAGPDEQILIFTCNYPIVMAIRSTNVYEERGMLHHTTPARKSG
jgi:hypothetical protein